MDLTTYFPHSIGFDRFQKFFDEMPTTTRGYPPYDIEKVSDTNYTLSFALAGFSRDDIEIEVKENLLVITGKKSDDNDKREFLHKGIANRLFVRQFSLADHMRVVDASLDNGILNISMEREIPEAHKPRKISIS